MKILHHEKKEQRESESLIGKYKILLHRKVPHSIFTFTLEYSLVILDQRRRKDRYSLEKEDDFGTLMANLIDQAAN